MKHNIYLLRDKVALTFDECFKANNDADAVRTVTRAYGSTPRYKDFELWRFDYAFDVETGVAVPVERAVVALPDLPENAPKMPMSDEPVRVARS